MQACKERNSRDKSSSQIENHSSDLLLLPSNHVEKLRFFLFFSNNIFVPVQNRRKRGGMEGGKKQNWLSKIKKREKTMINSKAYYYKISITSQISLTVFTVNQFYLIICWVPSRVRAVGC